mmetsp:Transcript_28079/g.44537  ORF Transcript_28079/g.44537 Transcript_28079/m.44537 type:complete len:230 (+) Transcript_28079:37-726(+)
MEYGSDLFLFLEITQKVFGGFHQIHIQWLFLVDSVWICPFMRFAILFQLAFAHFLLQYLFISRCKVLYFRVPIAFDSRFHLSCYAEVLVSLSKLGQIVSFLEALMHRRIFVRHHECVHRHGQRRRVQFEQLFGALDSRVDIVEPASGKRQASKEAHIGWRGADRSADRTHCKAQEWRQHSHDLVCVVDADHSSRTVHFIWFQIVLLRLTCSICPRFERCRIHAFQGSGL